jgi:hypothetical protein
VRDDEQRAARGQCLGGVSHGGPTVGVGYLEVRHQDQVEGLGRRLPGRHVGGHRAHGDAAFRRHLRRLHLLPLLTLRRDFLRIAHQVSRPAECIGHLARRLVELFAAGGKGYAAGLAVGYWTNQEDLRQNWQIDKTYEPNMDEETRAKLYKGWLKAVQRSMNWIED